MRTGLLIMLTMLAACGEVRPAREKYATGLAQLAAADLTGARDNLLAARSGAGVDPELRYRAAFNLGLASARHAETLAQGTSPKLEEALAAYKDSAMWFADALRVRGDEATDTSASGEAARKNLAVVNRRALRLADQLSQGENGLEQRLARLIESQRGVLDSARSLGEAAAAANNPFAGTEERTQLAARELAIGADAGVASDLAAAAAQAILDKPEAERTAEERGRAVALQNADVYLTEARGQLQSARRGLHDGNVSSALGAAQQTLLYMKRAAEQLADPVQVLAAVARDQAQTQALTKFVADAGRDKTPVPTWLSGPTLSADQADAGDRLAELIARFEAATTSQEAASAEPTSDDKTKARVLAQLRAALPGAHKARAAMTTAKGELDQARWLPAHEAQDRALSEIAAVLELFLDTKQTIDLTWTDHGAVMEALTDGPESAARARLARDNTTKNQARLGRLRDMLIHDLENATAKLQSAPPAEGADPAAAIEQERQRMARAEELRAQALASADALAAVLASGADPKATAAQTQTHIRELRKLFYSLIEHLQELIAEQGETKDQTARAHGMDATGRAPLMPPLAARQHAHTQVAGEIGQALSQLAAEPPPANGPTPPYAEAAEELRLALQQMDTADALLASEADPKAAQSVDLTVALEADTKALAHLTRALELLQPPQPEQDNDQNNDQDQKQNQGQDQAPKPEPKNEPQSGTAQRVRDREAERKQNAQPAGGRDVVDKDW